MNTIKQRLPGYQIGFASWDESRKKGIVYQYSDRLPVKYYLYDFETKDLNLISYPFPGSMNRIWLR